MAQRQPLADIQFIADFAAFCRTKGDERYSYVNSELCALGQFGHPGLDCDEIIDRFGAGVESALVSDPENFSALADRLEALIADAPVVSVSA
jgi:hypothetical protein